MTSDPSPPKRWPAFYLIFVASCIVVAAINATWSAANWGGAIGYMLVPAIVGWLIIYRAKSSLGVKIGFGVMLALIVSFASQELTQTTDEMETSFMDGCLNRNAVIGDLHLGHEEKVGLCSCISEKITYPTLMSLSFTFLKLQEPVPIHSNTTLQTRVNMAWQQCLAQVE